MAGNKFTSTETSRVFLEGYASGVAVTAGEILMKFYDQAANDPSILGTEIKDDDSPVTRADKAAHDYITQTLSKQFPGVPVISEENASHPNLTPGKPYWVVDPLDGTKEFLNRTGGFSVKIALIDNDIPVVGAVFSPAQNMLYHSRWNGPAVKFDMSTGEKTILATRPAQFRKGSLKVLFNERHANKNAYIEMRTRLKAQGLELPVTPDGKAGLPRNLQVAEGLADIFADCGQQVSLKSGCGFSWDYAADWLILKNAGGMMAEIISGREPDFKNPTSRRNAYVAIGDKKLGTNLFPNYP